MVGTDGGWGVVDRAQLERSLPCWSMALNRIRLRNSITHPPRLRWRSVLSHVARDGFPSALVLVGRSEAAVDDGGLAPHPASISSPAIVLVVRQPTQGFPRSARTTRWETKR